MAVGPRHHPWPVPDPVPGRPGHGRAPPPACSSSAYLSLGALLQLLVRNLAFGLSLTGIVCSPAFGFAGVGFPVLAMGASPAAGARCCRCAGTSRSCSTRRRAACRPQTRSRPSSSSAGWPSSTSALPGSRLRAVARRPAATAEPRCPRPPAGRSGVAGAFADEYAPRARRPRRLRPDRARAAHLWGALSAALSRAAHARHPDRRRRRRPFRAQPRPSSRRSTADEAIEVAVRPTTLAEAQAALARREVFGILEHPGRHRARGAEGRAGAPAGLCRFRLFPALQPHAPGHSGSGRRVRADLAAAQRPPDGSLYRAALARSSPVEILNQPLFNPTGGYGSYIVPAAFLLILQQTLLMGSATLGGAAFQQGGVKPRRRRGTVAAVLGQASPTSPCRCPALRSTWSCCRGSTASRRSAASLDLLVLAIPFILSVSFLGQFVGQLVQAAAKPRCCSSSPSACRSSSWSASPGRSRPSRRCCGPPAVAFPEHVGHRRAGAHQPDGRELCRCVAGLDEALDPDRRLRGPRRRRRPDRSSREDPRCA